MKKISGMFLLEILLRKQLPLAFLFVEAGLFIVVIAVVIPAVLARMGFGIFVTMSTFGILFSFWLFLYMKIYQAHIGRKK